MFWARSECLRELLSLPTKEQTEIQNHQDLNQILRQLLLFFAASHEGKAYRLHRDSSLCDYRYYEEERDFSTTIVNDDIKVLAYYLPQFHPIPENDEWHGKGFTEWTKVRGATPLFEGHYKQHIPHEDIGYYLLDSPETLRMQAEIMQKAGVHGQVFYHYWFSGKLILEEPVKMLLNTPDIPMPFCFCWANENWTRKWDGDEEGILLGQVYSREDARAFIRYLIPFFQDSRYIRIDDRPVLYIYRPVSIPDIQEYLEIWAEECALASLPRPYVVGVLTRGATDPHAFRLDAGTERVLHDWTDNAVEDITAKLHHYHDLNTHILSYDEVASFYEKQTEPKPFTYFRSIIPTWDNTARYGQDAYIVHNSTPQRFQTWLEHLIDYSRKTLDQEKRYIVVNAWNEWAEGAHLEPDTHYGYSYLNAIGRALSGYSYANELNASAEIPKNAKVHISLSDSMVEILQSDAVLKQQFLFSLAHSSFLKQCIITTESDLVAQTIDTSILEAPEEADHLLLFSQPALFDTQAIEKMLRLAYHVPESVVIPNYYTQNKHLYGVTENGSVTTAALYGAPFVLLPKTFREKGYKNIRMRTDANCFLLHASDREKEEQSHITTIVRFHKAADFSELQKALFSLAAMKDSLVTPLLALQDLDNAQKMRLKELLAEIPFANGIEPQIIDYSLMGPTGDLRTLMLNDALKKVHTRYAAFLDYDDLLFPDAYSWLVSRLKETGKAVSFGRVYAAAYNSRTGTLIKRERQFEYGYSYEDFFYDNHAPIHSFMLDLEQINLAQIIYHQDQKYMEDYYLTLQLFKRENCDWESLSCNRYIGDYIHSADREHTLAIADETEKEKLLDDPTYQRDEKRITDLRKQLRS
ncbi:MAG TPA: glycosyltransferase [Epsilonproteobacteria bacterium]|nr:glycosyltransferase [Campylobacterota bacterium]